MFSSTCARARREARQVPVHEVTHDAFRCMLHFLYGTTWDAPNPRPTRLLFSPPRCSSRSRRRGDGARGPRRRAARAGRPLPAHDLKLLCGFTLARMISVETVCHRAGGGPLGCARLAAARAVHRVRDATRLGPRAADGPPHTPPTLTRDPPATHTPPPSAPLHRRELQGSRVVGDVRRAHDVAADPPRHREGGGAVDEEGRTRRPPPRRTRRRASGQTLGSRVTGAARHAMGERRVVLEREFQLLTARGRGSMRAGGRRTRGRRRPAADVGGRVRSGARREGAAGRRRRARAGRAAPGGTGRVSRRCPEWCVRQGLPPARGSSPSPPPPSRSGFDPRLARRHPEAASADWRLGVLAAARTTSGAAATRTTTTTTRTTATSGRTTTRTWRSDVGGQGERRRGAWTVWGRTWIAACGCEKGISRVLMADTRARCTRGLGNDPVGASCAAVGRCSTRAVAPARACGFGTRNSRPISYPRSGRIRSRLVR